MSEERLIDEPALRRWVEDELHGQITRFERVGSGASRVTWLVDVARDSDDSVSVVVRADSGDGPMSGTPLDLQRESVLYRALPGSGVRAPRLLAAMKDGAALLIERAAGSDNVAALPEPRQRAVAIDYMIALGELHGIDTETLDLPGFERPVQPADCARLDLALWRSIYAERAAGSDLLVEFACDWLRDHAPDDAQRTSLCHGDAGPGNFLFDDSGEGERVTALLDWEFAHLGDPLDDLAWVAVRGQLLGGFGNWRDNVAAWERSTGLRAVIERIEYYRALVLVRMAISCRAALAYAGSRTMETSVYDLLLPYLHHLLPEALRRAGCDAPQIEAFALEAAQCIEQSVVLRQHARSLDELDR